MTKPRDANASPTNRNSALVAGLPAAAIEEHHRRGRAGEPVGHIDVETLARILAIGEVALDPVAVVRHQGVQELAARNLRPARRASRAAATARARPQSDGWSWRPRLTSCGGVRRSSSRSRRIRRRAAPDQPPQPQPRSASSTVGNQRAVSGTRVATATPLSIKKMNGRERARSCRSMPSRNRPSMM